MELSIPKWHVMSLTHSNSPVRHDYLVDDTRLSFPGSNVTDLGVRFDRTLSFNAHIEKVSYEALKILGFIKIISSEFNM